MQKVAAGFGLMALLALLAGCAGAKRHTMNNFETYQITFNTAGDPSMQKKLEEIDSSLRERFGMNSEQTAAGLLDLKTLRLAMINPDRGEYAASLPKIGILLAYFHLNPEAAANLGAQSKHELGLMVKASSNEMASKFSKELGLKQIQEVLNDYGFYDARHGGGLWVGKHYGQGGERHGDPVGDNSHAATVRQLLRFYLLLEQEQLVSREASRAMKEIFRSPAIPHDPIKFVQGLDGQSVEIMRKWGSWENWRHDSAIVKGEGKHFILVALTRHPRGDEYLVELSRAVYHQL